MRTSPAFDDLVASISQTCRSGLDPEALRGAILPRLRKAVPVDALWWALADPSTLLFTRAYREELPPDSGPYFVDNEYLGDDVNKWTELAGQDAGVATLMRATRSKPAESARYRDIFEPLGLEDELRAVLRVQDSCWGYLCLHREASRGGHAAFSPNEIRFIRRISPHVAEGIRSGLLRQACERDSPSTAPGLVLIAGDGSISGMNQAAERWLDELHGDWDGAGPPAEIAAIAALLRRANPAAPALPRQRIRTRSGRWAVLHASWMDASPGGADGAGRSAGAEGLHSLEGSVAVIVEEAAASDIAPIIMLAYGLTERERTITGFVCRGSSTRVIADRLHLSSDTVQDHLKSIFLRTGVHSRGELVAAVLGREYLPRAAAGDRVGRTGFFGADH